MTLNDDIPLLDDDLELDAPWEREEIVDNEEASVSHMVRCDRDKKSFVITLLFT